MDLDCPSRDEIEEDLCRINDIAREKGRFALQERAKVLDVEDYENLSLPKLAMTLHLDHRVQFDLAYEFHSMEKADNLHTLLGAPDVACEPTTEDLDRFKARLRGVFQHEAQGSRLLIEVASPHPEKWMVAIPHQTYVKPDYEFDEEEAIVTRDRRPIYEMVLIYYPTKGVLKVRVGRGRRLVEDVAAAFAVEILHRPPDHFRITDVVNFEPIIEPFFSFAPQPGDHFISAYPTQIRYRRWADPSVEFTIQCSDVRRDSFDILAVLKAHGVDPYEIEIRSMRIRLQFSHRRSDVRSVDLSAPNRVGLDETERDRYIERVLVRWGIVNHAARQPATVVTVPR